MIGWALRRWQRRYPGLFLAVGLGLLLVGVVVLVVWILRDLSHGNLMRPAIGVLVLAALTLRVMVSFKPHGG